MRLTTLTTLFAFCCCLLLTARGAFAQKKLYANKSFSILSDRVKQGSFEALAASPTQLHSNYRSPFAQPHSRLIEFKFSINGKDNEMPPGVNHTAVLFPKDGQVLAPVVRFGYRDEANTKLLKKGDYLELNTRVTFRLDMRHVFDIIKEQGYYPLCDGTQLNMQNLEAIYIAGASEPLSWNFAGLQRNEQFKMQDPDKDGIYEISLTFNVLKEETDHHWTLRENLSRFPAYSSDQLLVDASYNKSLEEVLQNLRPDGTWAANNKLYEVWTRHAAYSSFLSLALADPQTAKKTLLAAVNEDGIIVQDPGTGGSWPVSSDRVSWVLAAWEVYKVTGDKEWLEKAWKIAQKTLAIDHKTLSDEQRYLFYGESTYLDWREQTYPQWMEPVDIYKSLSLGSNVLYYQVHQIMANMAALLGESPVAYTDRAERIKQSLNSYFWMANKGYYGQYLYGAEYPVLYPGAEVLSQNLAILFGIADQQQQKQIVANTPVLEWGAPVIYPQLPGIPAYHNNAILPFINVLRAWAGARVGNTQAVEHALASVFRATALFVGNKENMVASNGDYRGTEASAERHLLGAAGNLAIVYRVLLGMQAEEDRLVLRPFIPKAFAGVKKLSNFSYRNARLTIIVKGSGAQIKTVMLDGKPLERAEIPASLSGEHLLEIVMAGDKLPVQGINLLANHFAPKTPEPQLKDGLIQWPAVEGAVSYAIYRNGIKLSEQNSNSYKPAAGEQLAQYQIAATDAQGYASFLSRPLPIIQQDRFIYIQAEEVGLNSENTFGNFTGYAYVPLNLENNTNLRFKVKIEKAGLYWIDFRYSNGSGEVILDKKAAIRRLDVDGQEIASVVMPQRGFNEWDNWGHSNKVLVRLSPGQHIVNLYYNKELTKNMDGDENSAMIDYMRLVLVE